MALLLVSLRIHTDDTRGMRYASVAKRIKLETQTIWDDGTSLYLMISGNPRSHWQRLFSRTLILTARRTRC